MKKILIVGGGANQIPLILASRLEGYFTVVVDYAGAKCPAYSIADRFLGVRAKKKNETIADECVLVGLYGTVVCHFIADKHIAVLANSNVVDVCCLGNAGEPDKG